MDQDSLEKAAFAGLDERYGPTTSLLEPVRAFVKQYMSHYDASHDWQHILRVVRTSRHILHHEPALHCDEGTVVLSALLHDVGDKKYTNNDGSTSTEQQISDLLRHHGASTQFAETIQTIVANVSYSHEIARPDVCAAALVAHPELRIVQDADRLDAIGCVGIARLHAYTAARQPGLSLRTALDHAHEKLLKLAGMMKTSTGTELAKVRHDRLQMYVDWWRDENDDFGIQ